MGEGCVREREQRQFSGVGVGVGVAVTIGAPGASDCRLFACAQSPQLSPQSGEIPSPRNLLVLTCLMLHPDSLSLLRPRRRMVSPSSCFPWGAHIEGDGQGQGSSPSLASQTPHPALAPGGRLPPVIGARTIKRHSVRLTFSFSPHSARLC